MKWTAMWGTAQSVAERREANFAKNLTVRYTIKPAFSGNKLRIHLSAVCNQYDAEVTKVFVSESMGERKAKNHVSITFGGMTKAVIPAGGEIVSDEIEYPVEKGRDIDISMYFGDFTEIATTAIVLGPLMKAYFAEGDFAGEDELPMDSTRSSNSYLFLDTVDVHTDDNTKALVAFGDSITAQSWVDFAAMKIAEKFPKYAIIRKGVSGARVLGQYDCMNYKHYGLSGENRFNRETDLSGADDVLVLIGINDIIHPDGKNPYRPMENFPSCEELSKGLEYFVEKGHKRGQKVYLCTMLPIYGWRTYEDFREERRVEINEWIRNNNVADGCIDLAAAVENPDDIKALKAEYDSGDHLHPSLAGAESMADMLISNFDKIKGE